MKKIKQNLNRKKRYMHIQITNNEFCKNQITKIIKAGNS